MISVKVAFRNLFRQKKRTVFTGLSMFVGFVLACISIGWAEGTYNTIIDSFTRNELGHIQIHAEGYLDQPSLYKTIDNAESISKIVGSIKGVRSYTQRIYASGLASAKEKSAGVRIIGVNPETEDRTTHFAGKVTKGHYFTGQPKEALIGEKLADILSVTPSDSLVIISQAADGSIANDRYTVIGLVDTGDPVTNRSALYLSLQDAGELFVLDNRVHEIAVTVSNLGSVNKVVRRIKAALSDQSLEVLPWQVFAEEFYRAMKADKGGMYIMLLVIVIVVAITVLNTVLMAVLERQKEYGVLRALGTRPFQIIKMVINEVLLLSFFSIVLGSIIGLGANYLLAHYGIPLGQPIEWGGMYIRSMQGEIDAQSFILPAITVVVTALVVSLFPAIKAARTEPAETMRMF